MGQITSLFVHKVIRQVDGSLDRRALLDLVGVDPDAAVDPAFMVADTAYYAFLEAIARSDPRAIDLPLRVGATMRCDDYGAFGLAWKSAVNLRSSYERAERYARALTSVSTYEVRDTDEGVYMHLHREGERHLGLRLSNEATIASIVAISQEVCTARFQPRAVYFSHKSPRHTAAHEHHFGCPVHFGAGMDALLVSSELLQQPNRLGDPAISKFFDAHLKEALSSYDDGESVEHRARAHVSRALSQGVPRISDVAGGLGLSGRTLQRRLADRGYSFQTLVDESRRELAQRLLRETRYPLAEIAFLTGFSEQSAFNRAFRRWAGQTPKAFRLQAGSESAG
ncbi:MAG: helix-turn-helix domain-containing protein [Betaproteobacteria bacterium]|nr:helix-turn-helix domain-containing protein [Betaproteobacteria bacterium]